VVEYLVAEWCLAERCAYGLASLSLLAGNLTPAADYTKRLEPIGFPL